MNKRCPRCQGQYIAEMYSQFEATTIGKTKPDYVKNTSGYHCLDCGHMWKKGSRRKKGE